MVSQKLVRRILFAFSCNTELIYVLNPSWAAQNWLEQLDQMQFRFLLRSDLNHRHGFATLEEVRGAVKRLRLCCTKLGFSFPQLTPTTWQDVLNRLHINFPAFFRRDLDTAKFQTAHEMNLLIHWLEYELVNIFSNAQKYIFNLDFNHFAPAYKLKRTIPYEELGYFSPMLDFGNLHLHYIHIGRHFLEMFDAQDFDSPAIDFQRQKEFTATCGLVFSESIDAEKLGKEMRMYFDKRGGINFFGFTYESLLLAKGFFSLGKLENLYSYKTSEQRQALRDRLKGSHIVNWRLL